MMFSWTAVPLIDLVGYLVVFFAVKRVYFELTLGAKRRAMIKEHGCEPVYHWQHQGILGRLLGLDVIQEHIKNDKLGRSFEGTRQKFFMERHTLQVRILGEECEWSF